MPHSYCLPGLLHGIATMNKYARGKLLGKGSFGCAILVSEKATGKQYVIKEISVARMPAAEKASAQQEAEVRMELLA